MKIEQLKDLSEQVVVLSVGRLALVFPQREIRTLEPVLDLESGENSLSIGDIVLDEGTWPIFALNENLELLASGPETGRVCMLMSHERWRFGLLCDKVANGPARDLISQPLPDCMRQQATVVNSLAVVSGQVMCLTRAEAIWRYLDGLGCGFAEDQDREDDSATLTVNELLTTMSL